MMKRIKLNRTQFETKRDTSPTSNNGNRNAEETLNSENEPKIKYFPTGSQTDEKQLMKLLKNHINSSGMIVYEGKSSELSRTGSPITALLNYMFYKSDNKNDNIEKPLDYDLFVSFVNSLK